jgi:hypothetical protein
MLVNLAQAIEKLVEPGEVISKAELISIFHGIFPFPSLGELMTKMLSGD